MQEPWKTLFFRVFLKHFFIEISGESFQRNTWTGRHSKNIPRKIFGRIHAAINLKKTWVNLLSIQFLFKEPLFQAEVIADCRSI